MIQLIRPYVLELSTVPFSDREDTVVYIESDFCSEVNEFIRRNYARIAEVFDKEGLEFIYVPEVRDELRRIQGDGEARPVRPSCIRPGARMAYHLDLSESHGLRNLMWQFQEIASAYSRRGELDYAPLSGDPETGKMLVEMERIARALVLKGVKTQTFEDMLDSLNRPCRMTFNMIDGIVLPEYGDMRIRLTPVEKTLYAFFLAHPDGILADELVGHFRELLELYSHASNMDDPSRMEDAIYSLCSEDKDVFYANVARIRNKLVRSLGSRLADHYVIKRDSANGIYRISLPRELVTYLD